MTSTRGMKIVEREEILDEVVEKLEELEHLGKKLGRDDRLGREILAQTQGRVNGDWLGHFLRDMVADEYEDLEEQRDEVMRETEGDAP